MKQRRTLILDQPPVKHIGRDDPIAVRKADGYLYSLPIGTAVTQELNETTGEWETVPGSEHPFGESRI